MNFAKRIAETLKENSGISDLVFRLSLSPIFIIGGLGHFVEHRDMLGRIAASPWSSTVSTIGNPSVLLWLSGIVFVAAGIALAAGFMTRLSCLALFVTLIPITIAIHIAPGHAGPLWKNVAILGALIHFMFNGSGAYAVDRLSDFRGETKIPA